MIDDQMAAFTAINHLAKKGYKRICGIFGNQNIEITVQRKKGLSASFGQASFEVLSRILLLFR